MFLAAFSALVLTVRCSALFNALLDPDVSASTNQISYRWDNAHRNAAFGEPDPDAPVDTSELADKVCPLRAPPRLRQRCHFLSPLFSEIEF